MAQQESFKFESNHPYRVELKFNEPKTGEGQYGTWYLYGAFVDGRDTSFFAPEFLHNRLQELGATKGSEFVIEKVLTEGKNGKPMFRWDVNKSGNTQAKQATQAKEFEESLDEPTQPEVETTHFNKNEYMARMAVVKSMLESGIANIAMDINYATVDELVHYCMTGEHPKASTTPVEAPTSGYAAAKATAEALRPHRQVEEAPMPTYEGEIRIEDVPF